MHVFRIEDGLPLKTPRSYQNRSSWARRPCILLQLGLHYNETPDFSPSVSTISHTGKAAMYRGTSLITKTQHPMITIGPQAYGYCRVLRGGVLMSEVPLYMCLGRDGRVQGPSMSTRRVFPEYRGTSLVSDSPLVGPLLRNRPPRWDHRRGLGISLPQEP